MSNPRGLAALPTCGDAESIVAHLALGSLACHLELGQEARAHIMCAFDVIQRQPNDTCILRAHGLSLVRVTTEAAGLSATVYLPMIDDTVIMPQVTLDAVLPAMRRHSAGVSVHIRDVAIDHITLRLRVSRLKTALSALKARHDLETMAVESQALLLLCIGSRNAQATPLDLADSYFSAARAFTRLANPSLAAMALAKANACVQSSGIADRARMSARIAAISGRLNMTMN